MKSKLYIFLTILLACTMQVKGVTSTAIVGNTTTTGQYFGFAPNYSNYAGQTIYLASEINKSGYITSLAYQLATTPSSTITSSVTIYMAETDATTMPEGKMDLSAFTVVYNNSNTTLGKSTNGWETISLSTPFYYSGKKNLVVAVSTSKATTLGVTYNCFSESDCRYIRGNSSSSISAASSKANYRAVTRFTFQVESTESVIGQKETTSASNGFGEYYLNYAGQTLYLADEIGQTGQITEIAFQADNNPSTTTGDLTVWMAETNLTELSNTTKLTEAEMTKVYDAKNISMAQLNGGYVSVVLNTPFKYSGTKNLVVAISSKKAAYKKVDYNCRNIYGRCVRISNDTSGGSVTPFDSNLSASTYVPVTRFGFSIKSNCSNAYLLRGTGTTASSHTGFNPWYRYYSAQFLYPADSLKMGYYLTSIGFEVKETAGSTSSDVRIYMAETDQSELSASNIYPIAQMKEVFNGTILLGKNIVTEKGVSTEGPGYEMVQLTTPFLYTGRKNLVIAVSTISKDGLPNVSYVCRTGLSNRAIGWESDNNDIYANFPSNITPSSYITGVPNLRFLVKYHSSSPTYTPEGLSICSTCGQTLPYSYQAPSSLASYTYGVTKPNHLNYIAQQVAWGYWKTSHKIYIQNDIDVTGQKVTAIGTNNCPFVSKLYGYNYSDKVGHTIKGLAASECLIEKLGTDGLLQSVRLESGKLVKTGTSGKVSSCLTLGSALFGSRTSTVIDSSFYVSNTANTTGGRTSTQMKSGMVTYGLNHAATTGGAKWYQTIGSDNYPVFDSSKGTVYRCTKCEKVIYTNTSTDEGKVYPHTWVNTICTVCNSQPTTFAEDQSLSFSSQYKRTVEARMTNGAKLTYKRSYGLSTLNKWQPLFVPFSFEYQSGWTEYFDIAEIQSYGVIEDTNEDGIVNSQDEKKLIVSYLNPGDITTANAPYLIMPKSGMVSSITFESCDGIVYPNTVSRLDLSTMKENVAIVGNYTSSTTSSAFQMEGGVLQKKTAAIPYFTWCANVSNKNGKSWDQNEINIFAHHLGSLDLIDGSSTYTIAQELVYDNVSYTRSFDEEMAHNWQAVYLPFDVEVEKKQDSEYPKYATFQKVRTEKGVEVFYLDMHEDGYVIPACTPFLVCFDEPTNLNLKYSMATVYPCNGGKNLCLSSDQANYTIAGVFAPTKPSASTWYAIARFDGKFHPASSTATLPAFRFYMTIEGANASELRFAFRDAQEIETGIATVASDVDNQDVYSLDGRKVQSETIQSGIYIKNGKKFSVRK